MGLSGQEVTQSWPRLQSGGACAIIVISPAGVVGIRTQDRCPK